jgi:hypothetical protein
MTSLQAALEAIRAEKTKLEGPFDPTTPALADYAEGFRDGLDEGVAALGRVEEWIVTVGQAIDQLVADGYPHA